MSEIIVEFPSPLTDKEKKMIYGYKGELVRCKDCKYYYVYDWNNHKHNFCDLDIEMLRDLDPNHYCAFAERREDGKVD